jgi:hypothetical protein
MTNINQDEEMRLDRHLMIRGTAILALAFAALPTLAVARNADHDKVVAAIKADQTAAIERLRAWIALPTIANMGVNTPQGAEYMRQLALDAGFQQAKVVESGGVPGVFATLDAGAKHTLAIYFMYDVKHYDPAEWSSPPLEGKIVERPGEGLALVGRGAVNQKGPQMASSPHCTRSRMRASDCPSTSSSWPRVRRKSARPIFRRCSPTLKSRRHSGAPWAS